MLCWITLAITIFAITIFANGIVLVLPAHKEFAPVHHRSPETLLLFPRPQRIVVVLFERNIRIVQSTGLRLDVGARHNLFLGRSVAAAGRLLNFNLLVHDV
jgi:hypothetical protein